MGYKKKTGYVVFCELTGKTQQQQSPFRDIVGRVLVAEFLGTQKENGVQADST